MYAVTVLPFRNIIVNLYLTWQKSCFRTFLLPALKLKKETTHKLPKKKLKLLSNPHSAHDECVTVGVALSRVNLPCTFRTLIPPICLPAASSRFSPCPLSACLFGQPLDQLHLYTVCTRGAKPPSGVPHSNFSVLWGTDAAESPLPSGLRDAVPGIIAPCLLAFGMCGLFILPPCLWHIKWICMWVAGQSLYIGENLSERTVADKHECIAKLEEKCCGENLITLIVGINRHRQKYLQDFFFLSW